MPVTKSQLVSVGRVEPDPQWGMAAHSHPFHELITVTAGRMSVAMNGQLYTAQVGQCLWYPAGVVHEERSDARNPVETHFIAFRWNGGDRHWPLCFADAKGRLATLTRWLLAERDAGPTVREAFLQAILAEFERVQTAPATPTLPERVRAYMRAHLAEPLTLADLAGCVAMSKFHFGRRYRALTGRTPMEDLRLIRLEVARDLLLTTHLAQKEIAARTGLGDEYHLSRLFRKHLRTAPGQLRR